MSIQVVCARYNENIRWLLPIIDKAIIYNKGQNNLFYIPQHKIINCENLGREGGTYIKHIIDNYDKLSDYTLFIQGNPVDHIFKNNPLKSYKKVYEIVNEQKTYHFKYISTWMVKVNRDEITTYCSGIPSTKMDLFPPINVSEILKLLQQQNMEEDIKKSIDNDLGNFEKIHIYEFSDILVKYSFFFSDQKGCNIRDNLYKLFNHGEFANMIDQVDYRYGSGAQFIVHKKQILRRPLQFWIKLYECLQELHPASGYGLEKLWPIIM